MDTAAAVFFCISLVAFEVSIRVLSWLLSFLVYFVCFVVNPCLCHSCPFVSIRGSIHSCPFVSIRGSSPLPIAIRGS